MLWLGMLERSRYLMVLLLPWYRRQWGQGFSRAIAIRKSCTSCTAKWSAFSRIPGTKLIFGTTAKAIDWDACEFDGTVQHYDEKCENGAMQLFPCTPGQLKVTECIGQDGDLSNICEPCPQKYYQSSYNKCTACHPCSECGPNERIMQPCTDEMDTVCERIIQPPQPPEPPTTTTTPSDVTEAHGQSPSTQPVATTSPGPTTFVSTPKEAAGKIPTTGEPTSASTTQNITAKPPGTVRNRDSEIYIGIAVLAILGWISFILLLGVHCYCRGKQKKKLKEERRRYHELNQRLKALSSDATSSHLVGQSDHDASDSVSKGANGSARHESAVDGRRGSSEAQRIDPVVDNPEDEKSLLSKVFDNLTNHLPSFVAKDSSGKKKKPSPKVTFHSKATGDRRSTSDPSVSFASRSLPSELRKDIPKPADSSSAESMKSDDAVIPPVGRRSSGNPQPCDEGHISMATAVVHSDGGGPGGRGCGDGESLVMDSVVHDGRSSHGVDPHDPRLRVNHTGQQHSRDSNSSIDRDLHWPAEKVPASGREVPPLDSNERWHAEKIPGSSALPPSKCSVNGNVSYEDGPPTDVPPVYAEVQRHKRKAPGSTELPITSASNEMHSENITDMDFEEPSLPEKVRGTGISNGRVTPDPDTEADAPKDNDHSDDLDPRTLRSKEELPRAPVAEEEDLPEDDGEDGGDVTTATADPDRDIRENLMKPEATVNNNTIPPDEGKHEDADGRGKTCRKKSFPFFNKMKRKDVKQETNQPAHQLEPLLNKMDNMVDEKCLDFVAGQMKLKKLDKLCRELGLKDTQVTNYRYELELQHVHGAELAFQMLVKIRESLGVKFTYRRLDRALRESKNVHVADEVILKFGIGD